MRLTPSQNTPNFPNRLFAGSKLVFSGHDLCQMMNEIRITQYGRNGKEM
jgi:hypothetical protein